MKKVILVNFDGSLEAKTNPRTKNRLRKAGTQTLYENQECGLRNEGYPCGAARKIPPEESAHSVDKRLRYQAADYIGKKTSSPGVVFLQLEVGRITAVVSSQTHKMQLTKELMGHPSQELLRMVTEAPGTQRMIRR